MKSIEIKKMLKARHPEIITNYSKVKILKVETYNANISNDPHFDICQEITINYNVKIYLCNENPESPTSGIKIYTIQEI